jgi:HSP20 family molecular chaperone IbpA
VRGDEVDPYHVNATFKNGVLTVILAKKPEARRLVKRIEIN